MRPSKAGQATGKWRTASQKSFLVHMPQGKPRLRVLWLRLEPKSLPPTCITSRNLPPALPRPEDAVNRPCRTVQTSNIGTGIYHGAAQS